MKRRAVIDLSDRVRTPTLMRMLLCALMALALTVVTLGLQTDQASAGAPGRDGKAVFVRANQIYTIAPDGTGQVKLTSAGKNYRPKWSPTGARLSYVNETATGRKDVRVMNANGTKKQWVTARHRHHGPFVVSERREPRLRRDPRTGRQLRVRRAAQGQGHRTVRQSTTAARLRDRLLRLRPPYVRGPIDVDRHLAWSTDGTTIVLYNHPDAYFDDALYMYSVATGEARQIESSGADCCGYDTWTDLFWGPTNRIGRGRIRTDQACAGAGERHPRTVLRDGRRQAVVGPRVAGGLLTCSKALRHKVFRTLVPWDRRTADRSRRAVHRAPGGRHDVWLADGDRAGRGGRMSANEPTTGWEAQAWDPATHPVAAARERTDRLARLTPPDHGPDDGPDDGPDEHEADEAFANPVVPGEVETTVPIGATGTAEVVKEPVNPEPLVEPKAFVEPDEAPAPDSADEWRELQVQFVDDPAGAVEGAAALVRQAVETRTGATGSTDTEHLRRAFTRLRDLHARLTGDAPA